MITDEKLMLLAKSGDMECISELFLRYHKDLYTFFYKQSRNDSLSKDLVQNVFERIIKYRERFREDLLFKPWLYKLAWNEQNDYYRKKRLTLPGDDHLNHLLPQTDQKTEKIPDEQKLRLKVAMGQLKPDQQQLLHMIQYQGLRYAEVADIMNCSLSAIKVRVHRTMKTLRTEYQKCTV